ncbi:MAG: O-antigen ligase family protein [Verrucomicrobiae bacterium]|nr:O-antigen ligase family protein [Verrucomicrobiae bacterium]
MKRWVVGYLAAMVFVSALKWVTPVVLGVPLELPGDGMEWLIWSWPNELGLLAGSVGLILLAWWVGRERWGRSWLGWLPVAWLGTQVAALPGTICWATSVDAVLHFAVAVTLFYLTAATVRDAAGARTIFGALGLAVVVNAVLGLQQWFGGLEATRQMAQAYFQPGELPQEFWGRLTSERVFGAMVYPNALAGLLVLGLGPLVAWVWMRGRLWRPVVRTVMLVFAVGLVLAVLLLTGSRGGLLAMGAAFLAWLVCGGERRRGVVLFAVVLVVAVGAVGWELGLLRRGAGSVGARLDYWSGAWAIARENFWLGTGPGTFGSVYPKYKTGMTEEAQMAHNNFLQMWSDSGVVAFGLFALMWAVACWEAWRLARERRGDVVGRSLVAALVGWSVHGLVDFDLYVPGLGWPAFMLMGLVWGLRTDPDQVGEPVGWTMWRGAWLAGAVVVTGFFAVWCGRSLVATGRWSDGVRLAAMNPWEAYRRMEAAAGAMPVRSFYWMQAGTLAGRLGRWDEAVKHWEQAVRRDPYRSAGYWWLAQARARAGRPAGEVVEALRCAVQLNPTKSVYAEELARWEESVRQGEGGLIQSAPNR